MDYNPGTGFLTDDSGVVLSYHRRGDLRAVGRLLVTTGSTDQSAAASLLCTSSCLSSQVSDKPNIMQEKLIQVSLVNVTSLYLWGSHATDMVKVSCDRIPKSSD